MNNKLLKALCFVLGLGPNLASAQQVQIMDNFLGGRMQWDTAAYTLIRWIPTIVDGEIYVCGAISTRGAARIKRFGSQMEARSRVFMGNTLIKRNLNEFTDISSRHIDDGLDGQMAGCGGTGVQGTAEDLANVRLDMFTGPYR